MAAIFESQPALKLEPRPGFVIKTRIVDGKGDHLYSTKVFINVCHEARVPKPPGAFEPSRVFPLIVKNEWEIPIIVSLEKKSTDKKGVPSFVYDCCINSECFQWISVSKDLRMITVEWCLESVEMMHELVLEREYSLPKMASKGELSATEVSADDLKQGLQRRMHELRQSETAGLIEELGAGSEPDEELPELANIGGGRARPLIEEIGEMTLRERAAPPQAPKAAEPAPAAAPGFEISAVSTRPTAAAEKHTTPHAVPYVFAVTPKRSGANFYILFESAQLTAAITVSHSEPENTLTITNHDPGRRLGKDNRVEIPVPAGLAACRSFLVEPKRQLYVFLEPKA